MVTPAGIVAVGGLPAGGWIGLAADHAGYHPVVVGPAAEAVSGLPGDERSALIALAIVYFEEALAVPSPPDGVEEATHREMAGLVGWLAETAGDEAQAREAQLALDAIEDGLPGDAVALRLMRLLEITPEPGPSHTTPEALELLLERASRLR